MKRFFQHTKPGKRKKWGKKVELNAALTITP